MQKEFKNAYPEGSECPDAVRVLRRALAEQPDREVILSAIGPLTNVRFLLESLPDDISPLSGEELVNQKLKLLCVMGGRFDENGVAEFNIISDVDSAKKVLKRVKTPIVFSPFETGEQIHTGKLLFEQPNPDNPVYRSYQIFCGKPRESWDPCTVLYSISPEASFWELSPAGTVTVSEDGITTFLEDINGKHHILLVNDVKQATDCLNCMIV